MTALPAHPFAHLFSCLFSRTLCALCAFGLLAAAQAQAQQPVAYKLAETIAPGDAWRYTVIDRRDLAPPAAADTVDEQTLKEDRIADNPHAYLRAALNARLAQEYGEKPLVEKHFAGRTMELRLFEVQLAREYPRTTNYASAGGGQGLLGVLIGSIMDGMASRNAMRRVVKVRAIIIIGGKPFETNSRRVYTDETLQAELIGCADAALESLALQLIDAARDLEKEASQAQGSEVAPAAEATPAPGTVPLAESATATK